MIYCPLIKHEFKDEKNCVHYEKPNGCTFWKSPTKKCEAEVRDG